jgi:hypothetical protein
MLCERGGFCSFAKVTTFAAFCTRNRKHHGMLVTECFLPREPQMRLNPFTDEGLGVEKAGEPR